MTGTMTPTAFHRSGEGTPLVLLHGITGSWRIWAPVIPALEAYHDVFAPTLPGHRGADPLPSVSLDTIADGIERSLDAAGLETVHLVGNSLGGWLSLELARRGRARSVVALSPAGAWRNGRDLRRVVFLVGSSAKVVLITPHLGPLLRRPRSRRALLRQVMEHGERVPPSAVVELLEDVAGCTMLADFMGYVRSSSSYAGGLDDAPFPIRIAWAEHDRTIPFAAYGRPMLDALPNAEHVTLPGVGHVPMYDDPALVVSTILEVTRRVDTEGGGMGAEGAANDTAASQGAAA
jgi:pimeloyl-ACP methyl ester carboxylesterase